MRATLADHAAGNYRVLMNLGDEHFTVAADRELARLDEKLFLDVFAQTPAEGSRRREETMTVDELRRLLIAPEVIVLDVARASAAGPRTRPTPRTSAPRRAPFRRRSCRPTACPRRPPPRRPPTPRASRLPRRRGNHLARGPHRRLDLLTPARRLQALSFLDPRILVLREGAQPARLRELRAEPRAQRAHHPVPRGEGAGPAAGSDEPLGSVGQEAPALDASTRTPSAFRIEPCVRRWRRAHDPEHRRNADWF